MEPSAVLISHRAAFSLGEYLGRWEGVFANCG
jgi:hypothetical protein